MEELDRQALLLQKIEAIDELLRLQDCNPVSPIELLGPMPKSDIEDRLKALRKLHDPRNFRVYY